MVPSRYLFYVLNFDFCVTRPHSNQISCFSVHIVYSWRSQPEVYFHIISPLTTPCSSLVLAIAFIIFSYLLSSAFYLVRRFLNNNFAALMKRKLAKVCFVFLELAFRYLVSHMRFLLPLLIISSVSHFTTHFSHHQFFRHSSFHPPSSSLSSLFLRLSLY